MAFFYISLNPNNINVLRIVQYQPWYKPADVAPLLTALQRIDPNTTEGRASGLELLASLVPARPFRVQDGTPTVPEDLRFSTLANGDSPFSGTTYIAGFRDGWDSIFSGLNASLQVPMSDPIDPGVQAEFRAQLAAMGRALSNNYGNYNFATFETLYELEWVNTLPKKTPTTNTST
jgi:hypothetical protein